MAFIFSACKTVGNMQYFKVSSEFTAYFIGEICSNRGEMARLGNVVFIRRWERGVS